MTFSQVMVITFKLVLQITLKLVQEMISNLLLVMTLKLVADDVPRETLKLLLLFLCMTFKILFKRVLLMTLKLNSPR